MNFIIKSISQIPFDIRMQIVNQYCKQFQSFDTYINSFSKFTEKQFKLVEHSKIPTKISLHNHTQNYYVKCKKTKTSYVFDIWYNN